MHHEWFQCFQLNYPKRPHGKESTTKYVFPFFFWLNREFDLFSKFGKIRHIRLYLTKFDTNTTPTIFIRRSQRKKIQIVTRKRTSGRESSRIGAINKAIKQLCCTVQNRIDFGMFRHCRRQDTLENTDKSRNVFVFFSPNLLVLDWIGLDWILMFRNTSKNSFHWILSSFFQLNPILFIRYKKQISFLICFCFCSYDLSLWKTKKTVSGHKQLV